MKKRPEYNLKATGRNMRRLREKKHLSVDAVRKYMGLASVQSIYRWELGCNFPTADNLLALAELYGVNPASMLIKKRYYPEEESIKQPVFLCAQGKDYFVLF